MGAFYGSLHFKTNDREVVLNVLKDFSKRSRTRLLVGPAINGWVSVYPEEDQNDQNARSIARRFTIPAIYVVVHDDDIFAYWYVHGGKLIDHYNSRPDYYEEVTEKERKKARGRPERLLGLLGNNCDLSVLEELLARTTDNPPIFASQSLQEFARLLQLPNALTSYSYLQSGETDGIERWHDFIHVPDTEDQSRKNRSKPNIKDVFRQFKSDGVLLVNEQRSNGRAGFINMVSPALCASRENGFYVTWMSLAQAEPGRIEHYCPPKFNVPDPLSLEFQRPSVSLVASSSHRFVANSSGEVVDLQSNKLVRTSQRKFDWVGFTADERALVCYSAAGELSVFDLRSQSETVEFKLPAERSFLATIHPEGQLVIANHRGQITTFDLSTGRPLKKLALGSAVMTSGELTNQLVQAMATALEQQASPDWMNQQREQFEASFAEIQKSFDELLKLQPNASPNLNFDTYLAQARQNFERSLTGRPQQLAKMLLGHARGDLDFVAGTIKPSCLTVSDCGRWLGCGTENGAAVFAWNDIEKAADKTEVPATREMKNSPIERDFYSSASRTYSTTFDTQNELLLCGCQDGILKYMNYKTGVERELVRLPGQLQVFSVGLSSQRNYLSCIVNDLDQSRSPELLIWDYKRLLGHTVR